MNPKEDRGGHGLNPKEGDRVYAVRNLRNPDGYSIPAGTEGTVTGLSDRRRCFFVLYDNGERYEHGLSYEGRSWNPISKKNPSTQGQLTIEQQKEMDLYVTTTTEVIEGVVPQVKYGDVIVWQGDPVAKSNDTGDLTLDQQHAEGQKVAKAKVQEVVKKQFS